MANLAAFCSTGCPLVGMDSSARHPFYALTPQGTCQGCIRDKVEQKQEWDIAACCIQQSSSTGGLSNHSNTETRHHSSTKPSQNGRDQSTAFLPLPNTSAPSPLPQTTVNSFETPASEPLDAMAIAIGATGAAFLIVCGTIIFYLQKRRQKRKLPPSAEFTGVVVWRPQTYRGTASSASSTFTLTEGMSFASSPYELSGYNIPPVPYSHNPTISYRPS